MKRVLFVDDEKLVLDGLRDLLRSQRKQWEMVFAIGGREAFAELEKGRFDVVVSDMRMPDIDGVALLSKVKELYPMTARIVLSGHADRQAVVAVLPVAHQFLTKPCDKDELKAVIERACGVQALLGDDRVRLVVGQLDRLPSIPRTYLALNQAMARAEVRLPDLAEIVEQDPAMVVKVLQLVNSSYFGLAQKQATLQDAVMYLGAELLRSLTLTAHVFSSASGPPVEGFSLEVLQRHSVLAARIAKRLFNDKQCASEAFTATLVHDIGKIVLAMSLPERFAEVIRNVTETGRPNHVVELEILSVTHAEVGAYLLGLWGLPLTIVEAVAYHHHPELVAATETLVAVHVANALSHHDAAPDSDPSADNRLNVAWVNGSAFGPELPHWRELADEEIRTVVEEPRG